DWHLNEYYFHQGLQRLVRDLNLLYKKEPALYEVDFRPSGFEWIDCSDWESSMVSFIRWSKNYKTFIMVVCNFTPVLRDNYRVGAPFKGWYKEILNSDAEMYGGGNKGNYGRIHTDDIPWMNRPCSLNLTIPPLGVLYLKMDKNPQ
ncbi:MAG: alpha amylase C-terminal domain-containing protein, partial [Candidatus Aureabacteria bacterium]|nr:alpha amylase C-terminal domain-containing protein [Candidatus Auribacterota bacterium]